MRVAFLFFLGIFLYIAAAEGNAGSLLACLIDPSALEEGITTSDQSGGTSGNQSGSTSGTPPGPFTQGTPPGPQVMQPDPSIKTNNGCKKGYVLLQGVGCYKVNEQAN